MLPAERARASFDVDGLVAVMRGKGPATIEKFRPLFSGAPFDGADMDAFRSYEDMWRAGIERHVAAMKIVRANPEFRAAHQTGKVAMGQMLPHGAGAELGIHFSMFLTFLQTQSTDEQRKKWLPAALKAHYWGVYGQTELGHGSNVRGIETTSTYDKATQEFVIHSPYLSSLKWWPTGMAGATHGVVFARLIIDGKEYGFHGFMVQFRDDKGYLMPGVEIGDIGPKLNKWNTNIGYARFTHVRIPRFNMFAKNQQVLPDGTYVAAPPKLSRFKYISMMNIRSGFVATSGYQLGKAATIVTRYSCVRRQGFKDSTATDLADSIASGEHVVLDYSNQQYRALKATGLAYMFNWNGRFTRDYLARIQQAVMRGDESAADELPELHATLCGMKVTATVAAHDQIEECRRDCGGQGFLIASGVADIGSQFGVASTGEGDRTILSMQVVRFLIKSVAAAKSGRETGLFESVSYLKDPPLGRVSAADLVGSPAKLVAMLGGRAARMARKLEADFEKARRGGAGFDAAINATAVHGYRAADAHSWYNLARNNLRALGEYIKDPATNAALTQLLELTLLQLVHEKAGDWLGVLGPDDADAILDRINELLAALRPDMVALTDGFGYLDLELNSSTLGQYAGNVYEQIYAAARKSPLNQSRKMVGWDAFAEVLDLDFLRDGMKTQHAGTSKL